MKYFKLKRGEIDYYFAVDGSTSAVELRAAGHPTLLADLAKIIASVDLVECNRADYERAAPDPDRMTDAVITVKSTYYTKGQVVTVRGSLTRLGREYLAANPNAIASDDKGSPFWLFVAGSSVDYYGLVHYDHMPVFVCDRPVLSHAVELLKYDLGR